MREAVVEVLAAREPERLHDSRSCCQRLAELARAAVVPDGGVRMAPVVEQLDRVRERPCRERHLVAAGLEQVDEGPEHDDVRGIRQIDPDLHCGRAIE